MLVLSCHVFDLLEPVGLGTVNKQMAIVSFRRTRKSELSVCLPAGNGKKNNVIWMSGLIDGWMDMDMDMDG